MKENAVINMGLNRSWQLLRPHLQREAFVKFQLGKLNDQNGIFGRHSDEHHQCNLCKYIEFETLAEDAGLCTGRERHQKLQRVSPGEY
jgi:hypothetical protein